MDGNPVAQLAKSILVAMLVACVGFAPTLVAAQAAPRPGGAATGSKPAAAVKPAVPLGSKISTESGKELVAVLDLEAVGASKIEASAMSDRLREELLKTGRYTLVDRAQMNAVLNEQALQQEGCTSQECAVQVGKVLGVKKLITGKVTKLAETQWLLSATLTDVETAETQRAESLRYKGDYFSMMDEGIVTLVAKLSAPVAGKPDMAAYLAAQQQPQAGAAPPGEQKEEKKGISKWWWIAGGVAVLAIAAAGSGGGGGGGGGAPAGCSNCGKVGVSW